MQQRAKLLWIKKASFCRCFSVSFYRACKWCHFISKLDVCLVVGICLPTNSNAVLMLHLLGGGYATPVPIVNQLGVGVLEPPGDFKAISPRRREWEGIYQLCSEVLGNGCAMRMIGCSLLSFCCTCVSHFLRQLFLSFCTFSPHQQQSRPSSPLNSREWHIIRIFFFYIMGDR